MLSILGAVVLAATAHESWRLFNDQVFDSKSDHWSVTALHCFSALNNGRKILSMKVSTSSDNLACIHGYIFNQLINQKMNKESIFIPK